MNTASVDDVLGSRRPRLTTVSFARYILSDKIIGTITSSMRSCDEAPATETRWASPTMDGVRAFQATISPRRRPSISACGWRRLAEMTRARALERAVFAAVSCAKPPIFRSRRDGSRPVIAMGDPTDREALKAARAGSRRRLLNASSLRSKTSPPLLGERSRGFARADRRRRTGARRRSTIFATSRAARRWCARSTN